MNIIRKGCVAIRNTSHITSYLHYLDWELGDALKNIITKIQNYFKYVTYELNIKYVNTLIMKSDKNLNK